MRLFALGICVLAAACGGEGNSPTSPTAATSSAASTSPTMLPAQTSAQDEAHVPMRGTYTSSATGESNCPPTCPPTILVSTGQVTGIASHLGRFTATFVDTVDLAAATGTGTFNFTAADGSQLLTETTGGEDLFTPPNISHVTETATIVGGTGRFAGATGTLTIEFTQEIDYLAQRSEEQGHSRDTSTWASELAAVT